jgi:hypothetical protein
VDTWEVLLSFSLCVLVARINFDSGNFGVSLILGSDQWLMFMIAVYHTFTCGY